MASMQLRGAGRWQVAVWALAFAGLTAWLPAANAQGHEPLPRASAEALGFAPERLARIVPRLKEEVDRARLQGGVLAIARGGRLALYESFGYLDAQGRVPMPRDAIFPLLSMTKPLTVAAALSLVEEGRLLLGEPLGRYLPALDRREVYDPSLAGVARQLAPPPGGPGAAAPMMNFPTLAAKRQPTVLDLMRHTAGLPYGNRSASELHRAYPMSSTQAAETMSAAEFVARLAALPLHQQPGTQWDYGLSIDVLGLVVEAVSGKPLDQFVDERLFSKLGMNDSGFGPPEAGKQARWVRPPRDGVAAIGTPRFACGGGCASATAADLLRFAQMLANQGSWHGQRVLARKSVEAMTSDQLGPEINAERLRELPSGAGYGYGLGVAVRRAAGGGASTLGSVGDYYWSGANGSVFWVDPKEQLVVVFLAQAPAPLRFYLRQLLTSLVLQALER